MFVKGTRIFQKENFLTEDELVFFKNLFAKKEFEKSGSNQDVFIYELPNSDEVFQVTQSIQKRAVEVYKGEYGGLGDSFVDIGVIHNYHPGRSLGPHADSNDENSVLDGFVIYLNDTFSGGSIRYANKNLEFKPTTGSLLIHPGSDEYLHEVLPVISGNRYSLTFFAKQA